MSTKGNWFKRDTIEREREMQLHSGFSSCALQYLATFFSLW